MKRAVPALFAALVSCAALGASAPEPTTPPVAREIIPGSELMTSPERERYRSRMRAARNAEEQAQVREQHVKQIRERARLRGLDLAEPLKKGAP